MTHLDNTPATSVSTSLDYDLRQRFFIQDSPVRGDVVRLKRSYAMVVSQKDYPESIARLLGEMLTAASLLIGTLKIDGTLSIQLQSSDEHALLNWAMAECDHTGTIRALANWKHETEHAQQFWATKTNANDAFAQLGEVGKGVLFINIQPSKGESYQGIVERSHDNLADCLAHYQYQSAQIPTLISLACDGLQAGGILVQLLPRTTEENLALEQDQSMGVEDDLWTRLSLLTRTVKAQELNTLSANEIIYRLYNEEDVVAPDPVALEFGCTCSHEKCTLAIKQIGKAEALSIVEEQQGTFEMDCGFCGAVYDFNKYDIEQIFEV